MATTETPRGRRTTQPRIARRPRPLLIAIGVVVLFVGGLIALNVRRANDGQPRAIATLQTADVHALAFSAIDANTVFFGHHNGLLVSHDQGSTWQPTNLVDADAMSLAAPPQNAKRMYAAGHGVFYRSDDGGNTWQPVTTRLQGADIHAFTASLDDANRVYAFVVNQGIVTSGDGGSSWESLPPGAPDGVTALAAGSGHTLYVGTGATGVWESTDGGQRWQPIAQGLGTVQVTHMALDPRTGMLYAATTNGLYRHAAGNTPWQALPLTGTLMTVSVSPQNSQLLLVVDQQGKVYRSRDGGASWGGY